MSYLVIPLDSNDSARREIKICLSDFGCSRVPVITGCLLEKGFYHFRSLRLFLFQVGRKVRNTWEEKGLVRARLDSLESMD